MYCICLVSSTSIMHILEVFTFICVFVRGGDMLNGLSGHNQFLYFWSSLTKYVGSISSPRPYTPKYLARYRNI